MPSGRPRTSAAQWFWRTSRTRIRISALHWPIVSTRLRSPSRSTPAMPIMPMARPVLRRLITMCMLPATACSHIHLQDADGYADRHWSLGEGTLPWRSVFAALAKLESNPRLIIEIRDKSEDPRFGGLSSLRLASPSEALAVSSRYRYKSARVGGRPLGPRARLVTTVWKICAERALEGDRTAGQIKQPEPRLGLRRPRRWPRRTAPAGARPTACRCGHSARADSRRRDEEACASRLPSVMPIVSSSPPGKMYLISALYSGALAQVFFMSPLLRLVMAWCR